MEVIVYSSSNIRLSFGSSCEHRCSSYLNRILWKWATSKRSLSFIVLLWNFPHFLIKAPKIRFVCWLPLNGPNIALLRSATPSFVHWEIHRCTGSVFFRSMLAIVFLQLPIKYCLIVFLRVYADLFGCRNMNFAYLTDAYPYLGCPSESAKSNTERYDHRVDSDTQVDRSSRWWHNTNYPLIIASYAPYSRRQYA